MNPSHPIGQSASIPRLILSIVLPRKSHYAIDMFAILRQSQAFSNVVDIDPGQTLGAPSGALIAVLVQ